MSRFINPDVLFLWRTNLARLIDKIALKYFFILSNLIKKKE
jgi:hypothetical protein